MKTKDFVVCGKGKFPIDMLRYDACYPIGPDDASKISDSDWGFRKVHLRTVREITPDRWRSFGWLVKPKGRYQ